MGINIAIKETECPSALCKERKLKTVRVLAANPERFGDAAETIKTVSKSDAENAVGDWESFVKRNKLSKDTEIVHMDLMKDEDDISSLEPLVKESYSGWVELAELDESKRQEAIDDSLPENRTTEWELVSFDEMKETCSICKVSWDKGRGCMGTFGPDNSLLPEIAGRHGCSIVASVPESASSGRMFTSEDAAKLLEEVETLRKALPEEGKMMVRRYSGPVDRMEQVALISIEEGCGFYFF
ncbi:MAG TPA: hypothetical protein VJX93_01520 [Candidatus Methanomethylophilaceae archaeon]|nr:hypothetical protein [Candidatus Methanomethylophilaceae archaeon]